MTACLSKKHSLLLRRQAFLFVKLPDYLQISLKTGRYVVFRVYACYNIIKRKKEGKKGASL